MTILCGRLNLQKRKSRINRQALSDSLSCKAIQTRIFEFGDIMHSLGNLVSASLRCPQLAASSWVRHGWSRAFEANDFKVRVQIPAITLPNRFLFGR